MYLRRVDSQTCVFHTFTSIFCIQIDYGLFTLSDFWTLWPRQNIWISQHIYTFKSLGWLRTTLQYSNLTVDRMIETIWSKLTGDPLRQVRACVWLPNFVGTTATTLPAPNHVAKLNKLKRKQLLLKPVFKYISWSATSPTGIFMLKLKTNIIWENLVHLGYLRYFRRRRGVICDICTESKWT